LRRKSTTSPTPLSRDSSDDAPPRDGADMAL
jgi:hypothetical protein